MKRLFGQLILKALPLIFDWLVAYIKSETERRERQRRADELKNATSEDEFDRASDRLP